MAKESIIIELKPKDRELVKSIAMNLGEICEELNKMRSLMEIQTAFAIACERDSESEEEEEDIDDECQTTLN